MESRRGDHTPIGSQGSDEENRDHHLHSSRQGSGIATPRPDGFDKRMPGISQSFLGQVGRFLPSKPSFLRHSSSINQEETMTATAHDSLMKLDASRRASVAHFGDGTSIPATPASFRSAQSSASQSRCGSGPVLVDRQKLSAQDEADVDGSWQMVPDQTITHPWTTPPASKKNSLKLERATTEPVLPPLASFRVGSVSTLPLCADGVLSRSPPTLNAGEEDDCTTEVTSGVNTRLLPERMRKRTLSLLQTSGTHEDRRRTQAITSVEAVTVHIASSAALKVLSEDKSLTMTAVPPCSKNTPPGSPRMSTSAYQNKHLTTVSHSSKPSSPDSQSRMTSRSGSPETANPGKTKGKLIVKIVEARGLRPSHDPFVVCSFESADFVSQGPSHNTLPPTPEPDDDSKTATIPLLANLRPRLIPTRSSRQSTQSLHTLSTPSDTRALMTHPKWNHEAIL